MKHILLIITILTGLLFVACSDSLLDQKNPNEMDTSNFWKTADDLQKGIDAAYRPLRFNGAYGRWLHILYVQKSDEGYSTSPNAYFQAYSNFIIKSMNDDNSEAIFFTWLDIYKGIFWANQVIDNSKGISMDETLKSRIQGEAYFLRGLHYFNIAEVYGRGPLKLTAFTESGKPVIAEQPEILAQALKDFETAIPLLPTSYTELTNVGRITQGAARGMRIKVLMQQHQWQAAADECNALINLKNSGGQIMYSLVPNYVDNFTQANENNAESVFEIQFATGLQNGLDVGCQRAKFMGIPVNGGAYADGFPRLSLYNEYLLEQTANNQPDPRLKATLAYYDPANTTETFYGNTWDQWKLDHKMVYWKKYTNYDIQTTEDLFNGINFRLIRLADIYLLYAEALNELGRASESYTYINKVRNRAGLPNLENSTVFAGIGNDHDKMKAQIMHERTCEMAGESTRWFDLERWGMFDNAAGISLLKTRDEDFNNFVIGVNNRFPIPYREVALVPITQNPGY